MNYDQWKTRTPEDDHYYPEDGYNECPVCGNLVEEGEVWCSKECQKADLI